MTTEQVQPITSDELLKAYARELILLSGKDGVGKSSAIVSAAKMVELLHPESQFNVIDTEKKFGSALRSFGSDAPKNIRYFPVDNMNQATQALRDGVIAQHKPGDWLSVESMARMWERAQNLAYEAVAGVSKIEYLDAAINTKFKDGVVRGKSPIPRPDDFWAVCKGAHDAGFLDLITNCSDLNAILTTTMKRPPEEREGQRSFDSKDRKILRAELGIDLNLNGSPSLPYFVETMCVLQLEAGKVSCKVLRDNNSLKDNTRPSFDVADRKSWAMTFWGEAR